jgi:hypothetical protein
VLDRVYRAVPWQRVDQIRYNNKNGKEDEDDIKVSVQYSENFVKSK